jgi:hypothetical protein
MMTHAIILNIEQLVRKSHTPLKLKELQAQYLQVYRNELDPEDFGVASLEALLLTMTDKLEVDCDRRKKSIFVFSDSFSFIIRNRILRLQ